jgi:thiamine biosynthesis lipoprotein
VVSDDGLVRFAARSMGSPLRLAIARRQRPGADRDVEAPLARAWAETIHEFSASDVAMSRFSSTSELTRLNRSAGRGRAIAIGRRLERAVVAADRARRVTRGRFDPRVLDDLEALGEHGVDLALKPDPSPARSWRAEPIARRTRRGVIEIDRPLDLGGIGKGLALRWAAARLGQLGIADYLLDAGGDLVVRGEPSERGAWLVGIEDTTGADEPLAIIAPPTGAVTTSSTKRRAWLRGDRLVHHLLDPVTGLPADGGLVSVTVAGADPAWAEIWSKTLFIGGRYAIADEARNRGLAAWWSTVDGDLEMTPAARAMTVWVRGELGQP